MLKPRPKDLALAWSLSKTTSDVRQMTIRVPSETFFKIQAIEAMFPSRNRNEIVSDLLSVAINEFVDSLPSYGICQDGSEISDSDPRFDEYSRNIGFSDYSGPRYYFYSLYKQAESKVTKQEDLESEQQPLKEPVKSALKVIEQGNAA